MFKILKKDIKALLFKPNTIEYIGICANLRLFFYYYFVCFVFLNSLSIFTGVLIYFFGNKQLATFSENITFLKLVIVAPIIEEILFRLLIKVNKINLTLFCSFCFVFILHEKYILPTYIYYVIIIMFLLLLFNKKTSTILNSQHNMNNSVALLIYLSSFLFGLFHLTNFGHINTIELTVIIYLFSKTLSGLIFILLRLKFGISSSIFFHISINLLAYLIVFS